MTDPQSLGPRGPFYREALARVADDFPNRDPGFDDDFETLVRVVQAGLQSSQEAYEVRQRLSRAEMANLSLTQAASLVEHHFNDACASWPAGPRTLNLITSAMRELTLAEAGAPNPTEVDNGPSPAINLLVEARGHLEIAEATSGPLEPGVSLSKDLIELALQDLAHLQLKLEQLQRGDRWSS